MSESVNGTSADVMVRLPSDRPRRRARWKVGRPPLGIALCCLIVLVVAVWAITGAALAPHPPSSEDLTLGLHGPTSGHLLGTDEAGRDVLSRLIDGSRTAMLGPIVVVLGAMLLGTFFGLLAGYRGGWIDAVIMRTVDLMYSLPGLLVAVVALGIFGGGYWIAVLVMIILTAPYDTRLIRGATLEQRSRPYVDAARCLGLPRRQIMARHIWPNIAPLIVANSFLNFAFTLVSLAALAFLGLGGGPGSPAWGQALHENLPVIEINPLASLAPGLALVLLALAMNLIGDWLYERLAAEGTDR